MRNTAKKNINISIDIKICLTSALARNSELQMLITELIDASSLIFQLMYA